MYIQELLGIVYFNILLVWLSGDKSTMSNVVHSIVEFSLIYAFSSTILFACLAFTLGNLIQIISDQVKLCWNYQMIKKSIKTSRNNEESSNALLLNLLDEWKSQYLLIRCIIDELNDTFNLALLIVTSSTFVRLINNSFSLLTPMIRGTSLINNISLYLIMIQDAFILVLISYVSHRLESKVKYLNNYIGSLK